VISRFENATAGMLPHADFLFAERSITRRLYNRHITKSPNELCGSFGN
jgi:hypothetical protein